MTPGWTSLAWFVAIIAAIPLVLIFMFTMRLFVKGLTAGAVKG